MEYEIDEFISFLIDISKSELPLNQSNQIDLDNVISCEEQVFMLLSLFENQEEHSLILPTLIQIISHQLKSPSNKFRLLYFQHLCHLFMKKANRPIEIFSLLQTTDLVLWFLNPSLIEKRISNYFSLIKNSKTWEEISSHFNSFLTISNLMNSKKKFRYFISLDPLPDSPPLENMHFQLFVSNNLSFFQQNFAEFYQNIFPIFQFLIWGFQILQLTKNNISIEENLFTRVFNYFSLFRYLLYYKS